MDALITYDFLHQLKRPDARQVYDGFAACMRAFASAPSPTTRGLLLDLSGDEDPDLNAANDELLRDFGPYPEKVSGVRTDGWEWRLRQWPFELAALDAAFERAKTLQARSELLAARAGIRLGWSFHFVAPETGEPLPGQDALPALDPYRYGDSSSILLTLRGGTAAVSLWLMFPFAEPDAAFRAFVTAFQAALPVRLSARHWRRWSLAGSGAWKARKFAYGSI